MLTEAKSNGSVSLYWKI